MCKQKIICFIQGLHGIENAWSKCYIIISLGFEISQSCLRRDWTLKLILLKSALSFEATILILGIMKFTYDFKKNLLNFV